MLDSIINLLVGSLEDKKEYKALMKRAKALPREYSFAFDQIKKYMYTVGTPSGDLEAFMDLSIFTSLIEFFEQSVAEGKGIQETIGTDVAEFADNFMTSFDNKSETTKEKLNKEILEGLKKIGGSNDKYNKKND